MGKEGEWKMRGGSVLEGNLVSTCKGAADLEPFNNHAHVLRII